MRPTSRLEAGAPSAFRGRGRPVAPGREIRKRPATAELLVWLTVLAARGDVTAEEITGCALGELPALSVLIKDREDLAVVTPGRRASGET